MSEQGDLEPFQWISEINRIDYSNLQGTRQLKTEHFTIKISFNGTRGFTVIRLRLFQLYLINLLNNPSKILFLLFYSANSTDLATQLKETSLQLTIKR